MIKSKIEDKIDWREFGGGRKRRKGKWMIKGEKRFEDQ